VFALRGIFVLPVIAVACVMSSCSSVDLPSVSESERSIATVRPLIEQSDKAINIWAARLPVGDDVLLRIALPTFNAITSAIAGQRSDDVRIAFPPTRPFRKEDKSILGITYANTLDIDTGTIVLNLSTLRFDRFRGNTIDATIGIEGKGRLKVSGRYTGIPASASPDIEMSLKESIQFVLTPGDSGVFTLRARKQTLNLHTTFSVRLIDWQIPFSKDIPLEATDLIAPIRVPMSFAASIPFPVPAPSYGDERVTFVPHDVVLYRTTIRAENDVLEIRTNFQFKDRAR
jgi:hypothetical protein